MIRRPPRSTLFPSTPLFRSEVRSGRSDTPYSGRNAGAPAGLEFGSGFDRANTRAKTRSKARSEEHTSELQSQSNLVCRLLLEKKKTPCFYTRPHPHESLVLS